jgi:hypothetical protein
MAERDFLELMIDKRTVRNPEFPQLLAAVRARHGLGDSTVLDFVAADLTDLSADMSTQPEQR